MAIFPVSAGDALKAAIEMQNEVAELNTILLQRNGLRFRSELACTQGL